MNMTNSNKEHVKKIIAQTFEVIKKVYDTRKKNLEIVVNFVNLVQESYSLSTVSVIVMGKLVLANKS